MRNNKRALTVTEKVLMYLLGILGGLFVLIVAYGFISISREKPEETKAKTENATTEKLDVNYPAEDYEGDYPSIGDEIAFATERYDSSEMAIIVNSVLKSGTLDEAFAGDTEIKAAIEGYKSGKDVSYYESELRYLYINLSMRNFGEKSKDLSLINFSLKNYYNDEMLHADIRIYAFEYKSGENDENGVPVAKRRMDLSFKPDEEKELVFVCILPPCSVYDLYLSTNLTESIERLINLDVALGEVFLAETADGQLGDIAKRKYKQHKIESEVLNYNIFKEQKEGIPCLDRYLYDAGTAIEPYFYIIDREEHRITFNSGMEILEAAVYDDINKLPEQFSKAGYLESMLDVYMEQLPYEREEYRYLFIQAELTQSEMSEYSEQLSEYFWLYNRDYNGNLWYLGYPDDFYIVYSSEGQKYAPGSDYLVPQENETIGIMAAYVIVPDTIYDVYIMNKEGELEEGNTFYTDAEAEVHNGGISLNLKYLNIKKRAELRSNREESLQ